MNLPYSFMGTQCDTPIDQLVCRVAAPLSHGHSLVCHRLPMFPVFTSVRCPNFNIEYVPMFLMFTGVRYYKFLHRMGAGYLCKAFDRDIEIGFHHL